MVIDYSPEMEGPKEITTDSKAVYVALVNKYRVACKEQLTACGKGVSFDSIIAEFGANNMPNKFKGWYSYYMTPLAFKKFSTERDVTLFTFLD